MRRSSPRKTTKYLATLLLLPGSAKESKARNLTYYFTGKPCNYGHYSKRHAYRKECVACMSARRIRLAKEDWQRNPQKYRDYAKAHYHANREKILQQKREWEKNNPEARKAIVARYREKNRDFYLTWGASFKPRHRRCTPLWIVNNPKYREALRDVYLRARAMSLRTGILHVVDHIVPMKHPLVCGLHVPWNLQVLSFNDNVLKSNYFEVG